MRHCAKAGHNPNMVICRAINKYGKDNFIIEQIDKAGSIEELNVKEIEHVKKLNTFTPHGYNCMAGGGGTGKMSEDTRTKHSKTYTIISPDGEIITITNLFKFAQERKMEYSCLNRVARGLVKSYFGWTSPHTKHKILHLQNIHTGVVEKIPSMYGHKTKKLTEIGLTVPAVWALEKGKIQTTKGWRLIKIEKFDLL